jgi:septal ring factor EnvC (AmiA/AmiB activator)
MKICFISQKDCLGSSPVPQVCIANEDASSMTAVLRRLTALEQNNMELRESDAKLRASNTELRESDAKLRASNTELRESDAKQQASNMELWDSNMELQQSNDRLEASMRTTMEAVIGVRHMVNIFIFLFD